MGQYYTPILGNKEGQITFCADGHYRAKRQKEAQYMPAKLMEHSYLANYYVESIAGKLYYRPGRVAWFGDYTEESDLAGTKFAETTGITDQEGVTLLSELMINLKMSTVITTGFTINGKYLLNHDKKQYLEIFEDKLFDAKTGELAIHPLPLLTCTCNHSGGSYRGSAMEAVGSWCWDLLEIVEAFDTSRLKGYECQTFTFKECR